MTVRLVARCECFLHPGYWFTPARRSRVVGGWIVAAQPEQRCPQCDRVADMTVGLCLIEEPVA